MILSWEKIVPKDDPEHGSPCERSSHGLSVLKGGKLLILYGGEQVARTPLEPAQTTWAAEEVDGAWSWRLISSPCPPARVAHAQCVYDDSVIYVFGGRAGITMGEKAMNDLWKLDCSGEPGTETWSLVTPDLENGDQPPEARSFHKALCLGTTVYVFGGCGANGRMADLHSFDISTSKWRALPASSLLRGRGGPNFMTFDSGKLLGVVAGFCGEESNDGHMFDIASGSWQEEDMTKKLTGLRPRSVCVSASFPSLGVSVIFGGEVDPSEKGHEGAGGFANDVVLLDEKTGSYIICKPADDKPWPEERGWSDGDHVHDANGGGKLYVYGGLSGDDSNPRRLNDLWRLDIQPSK
eukprot:scaffold22701_cov123-Cylindrotheca_fusiformis.AAC.21